MAEAPPPLVVRSLGRRYRRRQPWALRNVDLDFPAASITGLVGPNGAGKSTLIRSCLGFERPDEGAVAVYGVDPRVDTSAAVRSIGYISQAASLHRRLTIGDYLALANAARSNFSADAATQRIAAIGLSVKRKVGELSGGERAQVALTVALATNAPLLLLDEPLASLDPLARREFLAALAEQARRFGRTVVLSSHIVGDIESICDRIVILGNGRLLLESSIDGAKARFRVRPAQSGSSQAAFTGSDGQLVELSDHPGVGRLPTLEEIVLGHLALGTRAA